MARIFKPSKQPKLDAKHYQIAIERLDHQGAGIGYKQKKTVFVEGALPGEQVVVQNVEQKSKFARAKLIKIIQPSDARVKAPCPHYQQCGGCNLQHLGEVDQLAHKQQSLSQQMGKFAGVSLEQEAAIDSSPMGYRRRVRLSCRFDRKAQRMDFGFRAKQSNAIVNIEQCVVLAPALQALIAPLRDTLESLQKPADVGHIELIEADNTNVLYVRVTTTPSESDRKAWLALASAHNLSLYLHQSDKPLELVQGPAPQYTLGELTLDFLPTDFIQVNAEVNRQMVTQALEWLSLSEQDKLLDLFCGMGNFSLPLAQKAQSVIGIEGVPEMVERASQNATSNKLDNAHFLHANLERYSLQDSLAKHPAYQGITKVLLDPARAGAAEMVAQLPDLGADKILYVSCNPTTLSRDSKVLLESGYRLTKFGVMNMFPQTAHIEGMALFEKE